MGWLFGHHTRKSLIDHLVQGNGVVMHRHCLKGNNLWAVQEHNGKKYIALYLIKGNNGEYGWGYKDLDETAAPYYYNCPLSYLDLVDEPYNENAAEWRDAVRRYHAAQAAKRVGCVVAYGGTHYRLGEPPSSNKGRWVYRLRDHAAFIMKASQLKRAELCLPTS